MHAIFKFQYAFLILLIFCSSCEKDSDYDAGTYLYAGGKYLYNVIPNAVTDYDGNTYDAVKIGEQVWMRQNLRTKHYADSTSILQGSSYSSYTVTAS